MLFNSKQAKFEAPDDAVGSTGNPVVTPDNGSVTPVTPPQGAADGGQDYAKKYEELLQKSQSDINQLKSTLQRQQAQQQQQWQQERQQMEEKLRQAQLVPLDDDARKEFLRNLELEKAAQYRQQAEQAQRELEEERSRNSYREYFIAQGVPADKLITDQGLEVLVNSGWQGIQAMMSELKSELQKFKTQSATTLNTVTPQTPVDTPRTPISATPAPAGNGTNWDALVKKYGSAEEVYRLVEQGELPPSIIPAS